MNLQYEIRTESVPHDLCWFLSQTDRQKATELHVNYCTYLRSLKDLCLLWIRKKEKICMHASIFYKFLPKRDFENKIENSSVNPLPRMIATSGLNEKATRGKNHK